MKKLLLSILTFLYLMVSSGVAMEIHYCMGKRAGTKLFTGSNDRCGLCGMKEKKNGCCHDEQTFYKLTVDHKHADKFISIEQIVIILTSFFGMYQWQIPATKSLGYATNHSPPLITSGAFNCILHGVFRL